MAILPGRCTPNLQAGDIGTYKSFKGHMATMHGSDQIACITHAVGPAPTTSVTKIWQSETPEVVAKSIGGAGFYGNFEE
ncbi:LOW QUALITY PROTEIN: Hypothetical protein PHPALM_6150 [Phytophthora palmivora]|uniref:Uncharacterized protein n=1 Tax=Phytophthora palmivora TaxID=4796 RepID=A0A2P4YFW8_9STRA|nr:LOW QUALITY PROTEIN: Hypothetical protein PHPALM_6150 [Phytophthora palmivora]